MSHRWPFSPLPALPGRWLLPGCALSFAASSFAASLLAASLLAAPLLLSACTLTGDDFEPVQIDAQPVLPREVTPGPAPEACAAGAECCDSSPCADGEVCRDGGCEPASGAAPNEASCPGGDCSLPGTRTPEAMTPEAMTPQTMSPEAMPPEAMPPETMPPPPTCEDGLLNGDETEADCGGGCPDCPDGSACGADADCESGRCTQGNCAVPTCNDGVTNGSETSLDCGGACPNCPPGRACDGPGDCLSGVCEAGGCGAGIAQCCQAATCNDGVQNTNESDVDCGGRCPNCADGRACDDAGDCQSAVCDDLGCAGGGQCCQEPSCSDGVANGDEPVVDCGNLACGLCALGSACADDAQCQSGLCQTGACTDSCGDGQLNGTETSVDCGGLCPRCADRLPCTQASDCVNNNCFENVCISCGSGVIDGTETDIDCGGADPFCRRCDAGRLCLVDGDCASNFCNNGLC